MKKVITIVFTLSITILLCSCSGLDRNRDTEIYDYAYNEGRSEGYEDGFDEGKSCGYDEGYNDGYAKAERDFRDQLERDLDSLDYDEWVSFAENYCKATFYYSSNEGNWGSYNERVEEIAKICFSIGYRACELGWENNWDTRNIKIYPEVKEYLVDYAEIIQME